MYRKTPKVIAKLEAMRAAKERKRLAGIAPDYPPVLPDLRRTIIVIDYDSGVPVHHQIELHRTGRIDQYRAVYEIRLNCKNRETVE